MVLSASPVVSRRERNRAYAFSLNRHLRGRTGRFQRVLKARAVSMDARHWKPVLAGEDL